MEPLRIAIVPPREVTDPNRGILWELVDAGDRPDYTLAFHERVHEAILGGEADTRTALHLVTPDGARGPLLLLGPIYPLAPMALDAREREDVELLARYAELHRRWMETSWDAMLSRAVELLSAGTVQIVGDVVWVDGAPGPCRMGEAPRECHEPETMLARGIPRSCPFIG